jgi:hypothetical protein
MLIKVVNMIPNSMSNETTRDSEPNISATYLDPLRIAASAFTPDPLNSGNAPIYISTDGGDTWVLNVVLPGGNKTGDTTLRFAGASNVLYAGILRSDNSDLNILRKADFTAAGLMTVLVDKTADDQPWVEAGTVMAGSGAGSDRVYVGENDFNAPAGHTATVDVSLDAATAAPPAGFVSDVVETRATSGQDSPQTRPAVHLDGTIYAVFLSWKSATTMDVVVVRDDNWGSGAIPFTSLMDGGNAGKRVVLATSRCPLNNLMGTQRVGANCAIAVDPRDSSVVYIAWADGATSASQTIRVRRSIDRGVTWSGDLRTVTTATNAGLAINSQGVVAFLYQQLHNPGSGNRWQTHVVTSSDGFTTVTDSIMADLPDANGTYTGANPIGDYANVIAVGKNFYGVFCGNNTPDNANFPNGVTYQRNADFTTHTLKDLGNNNVGVSIDPFFFKIVTVAPEDDFYVRDWTDSATSGDNGAEPSTHNVFYHTSDVWNRRGTLPGTFVNDQPPNEDAGNGAGNVGDNWAFARIRRNAPAASGSQTVTAHFLVSKFGTGSSYVDSTSGDPDLSFPDPDPTITFAAADTGPTITDAYHWHLNAIASTHLCLAVEISSPNDPFVAPSLVGNTPGWPTTDLRIINDNNKAQRNMALSTTPARGVGMSDCFYAIVHNAATIKRNFELHYDAPPAVAKLFAKATIEVIGGENQPFRANGVLRLANMQPGENRWVGLRFPAAKGRAGQLLAVNFQEVVNGIPVNGFAVGAHLGTPDAVIRERLFLHQCLFNRIAADFKPDGAQESAYAAAKLGAQKEISSKDYLAFVGVQLPVMERAFGQLVKLSNGQDPFGVLPAFKRLPALVKAGSVDPVAVSLGCIMRKADSFLTMRRLQLGDVADILLNVRWQNDLFTRSERLKKIDCGAEVRALSRDFVQAYGVRKATNKDYPGLTRKLFGCLQTTAKTLGADKLQADLKAIQAHWDDLVGLQTAHRDFLLHLQTLVKD